MVFPPTPLEGVLSCSGMSIDPGRCALMTFNYRELPPCPAWWSPLGMDEYTVAEWPTWLLAFFGEEM